MFASSLSLSVHRADLLSAGSLVGWLVGRWGCDKFLSLSFSDFSVLSLPRLCVLNSRTSIAKFGECIIIKKVPRALKREGGHAPCVYTI